MTEKTIEQWLSETIGLDTRTVGPQALAIAVKRRMAACGLTEESAYLKRLAAAAAEPSATAESSAAAESPAADELQTLIELIVVPETWFFRDREPFVFMSQHVKATWLPAHPHDLLHVLSVPCSSGEEPYSIAMALQSTGLRPSNYRIDAVDINPALLHKAEKGVYGPNSFRGGLLENCERYFTHEGALRIVKAEARSGIRFIHGNIMTSPRFAAEQTYDIIFCRNLLIYQHAKARGLIIDLLDRLLKPEGLLFVGHAEMMTVPTNRYEPVRHSGAFAYCKIKANRAGNEPGACAIRDGSRGTGRLFFPSPLGEGEGHLSCSPLTPALSPRRGSKIEIPMHQIKSLRGALINSRSGILPLSGVTRLEAASTATSPSHESPLEPTSRLDRVRALADQGRLDGAAALCQDLLKESPQLTEAHFLLGMIRAAEGQDQAAEECLNRALYLDADCYEALIHLSLLKARRGDEEAAERLRRHAERIRDRTRVTT